MITQTRETETCHNSLVKKPPGSWRDLGGIPPGFPPGPAEILAAGISVPRRESRRDLGGITSGIPPRFWPPGFRFAPRAPAGSPAEILAAEFSLPAVNPGGIITGIPPRFWPPGFRFAPRIPAGTWRELLSRFWPPGFCFLPRIPSGSWWAHSPRFWSPRFPFLAENLAKIPPRFSAQQDWLAWSLTAECESRAFYVQ